MINWGTFMMKAQTTQMIAQTQMIEFASITPRPFR